MTQMEKPKKREREAETEEDAISRSLAAYGERFMDMFEDADRSVARQARTASIPVVDSSSKDSGSDESEYASGSSDDTENDGESNASDGVDGDDDGTEGPKEFVFSPTANAVVALTKQQQQQQQQQRARARQKGGGSQQQGASGGGGSGPPSQQQERDAVDAKLERKAFMSSKAAKVHAGAAAAARASVGGPAREEPDGLSREEFLKMQREVQLYGAQALDKRSRKRFEAAILTQLGAKASKSPRIPAKIGLGMAKKAAKREARALEEAIDSGMMKRKGLGRKKKEEKRKSLDRGLMEDRGAFRGGIMRVKTGGGGGKRGRR